MSCFHDESIRSDSFNLGCSERVRNLSGVRSSQDIVRKASVVRALATPSLSVSSLSMSTTLAQAVVLGPGWRPGIGLIEVWGLGEEVITSIIWGAGKQKQKSHLLNFLEPGSSFCCYSTFSN